MPSNDIKGDSFIILFQVIKSKDYLKKVQIIPFKVKDFFFYGFVCLELALPTNLLQCSL